MRSTLSADRVLGRRLHEVFPELVWRAVAQRLVRMDGVVMLEPRVELAQHTGRIGFRADPRVIPLDGFDEGLGHTVRLGALDRRRARNQADIARQSTGLTGGVRRAVIRQPFNRLGQFVDQAEAALDAFDHQVANVGAVDAAGRCHPGDRLAVAAVEREGDPHLLAVVAADFEPVRAPAGIGAIDRDAAIMPPFLAASGMALEQQTVRLHDPVDPLHVHHRAALLMTLTPQQRMDAAVAVGRLAGDQHLDLGDEIRLGLRSPTATLRGPLRCRLFSKIGTGHTEGIADRLHGMSSRAGKGDRNSRFFGCANSSASRNTSFSKVFLPSSRCNSRTWCCRARYSEAGTTSSPAPTANSAPSAYSRRQVNT